MQKTYSLNVPGRVIAGIGCVDQLTDLIKSEEKDNIAVFVDSGALKSDIAGKTLQDLKNSFSKVEIVTDVPPEPEDRQVRDIFHKVEASGVRLTAVISGGSVIDTSKIIAPMLTN